MGATCTNCPSPLPGFSFRNRRNNSKEEKKPIPYGVSPSHLLPPLLPVAMRGAQIISLILLLLTCLLLITVQCDIGIIPPPPKKPSRPKRTGPKKKRKKKREKKGKRPAAGGINATIQAAGLRVFRDDSCITGPSLLQKTGRCGGGGQGPFPFTFPLPSFLKESRGGIGLKANQLTPQLPVLPISFQSLLNKTRALLPAS